MADPAMRRRGQPQNGQSEDMAGKTYMLSDGREIEYTLDGEYRLLQKVDEMLQVLNTRKAKRKK